MDPWQKQTIRTKQWQTATAQDREAVTKRTTNIKWVAATLKGAAWAVATGMEEWKQGAVIEKYVSIKFIRKL